jgi:hypothetical protein
MVCVEVVMTITVPKLKNNRPILVAPGVQTYYPKDWTWQDHMRELEIKYNKWIETRYGTHNVTELGMQDVNDIMQKLYPGPYRVVGRVVAHNRPYRVEVEFSLEFDDPKEQTFWLLKNS